MIITACICFYNAVAELERCLESLDLGKKKKGGIDQAICIDGKYPNFEGKSKISTDGSLGIVKSFPHTSLYVNADYEIHKRNRYLELAEETSPATDYILIIDSDEYIDPENKNWKGFRENLATMHNKNLGHDIWSIDIESNSDDYVETVEQILGKPYQKKKRHFWDVREYQPKPRIWYHPWQFEYFLNHYTWRHKDPNYPDYMRESVFGVTSWDVIPGIKLLHDHKLRNQEHLEKRLQYHRWLIQFEQQKAGHYFKHHDFKPLPHDLSIVDKWVP
jgi:glycosyltransferase involved in cell wall biosynthesis